MDNTQAFSFFYGNESEQFRFYRIPRLLITGERFRGLSTDAKLLYGLMLDRMELSARNGWYDSLGRVYIYFTLEQIEEALCCGHNKAVKLIAELDQGSGIGLIERRKQGQGKPTIIYVKRFTDRDGPTARQAEESSTRTADRPDVCNPEVLTSENQTSRLPQTGSPDFSKANGINTDGNNTDSAIPIRSDPSVRNLQPDLNGCRNALYTQLGYTGLTARYPAEEVDGILELIAEVLCSTNATIRDNGSQIPIRFAKERFQKLDQSHIEYVIACLRQNTTNVRNIRAYLLTMLYNAPTTIEHYYQAKVQHDLYGQP